MRVRVSFDEGKTFEPECDLSDCFPDKIDDGYHEAFRQLDKDHGARYWTGGGAAPIVLVERTD